MIKSSATDAFLNTYSQQVFGSQDDHLAGMTEEATAAGLPDIAVSADVGRFLKILTSMTPGRLAIEVGTLAGYSGIWIARGLAPEGQLITIEHNPQHASHASSQFERAGVAEQVEVRVGDGIEVLEQLAEELPAGSVDVLFLDAIKYEYSDYFRAARSLIASGGLVLADNVYGSGSGWIDTGYGTDEFNRLIAADPNFETVAIPLRQGILISRRVA